MTSSTPWTPRIPTERVHIAATVIWENESGRWRRTSTDRASVEINLTLGPPRSHGDRHISLSRRCTSSSKGRHTTGLQTALHCNSWCFPCAEGGLQTAIPYESSVMALRDIPERKAAFSIPLLACLNWACRTAATTNAFVLLNSRCPKSPLIIPSFQYFLHLPAHFNHSVRIIDRSPSRVRSQRPQRPHS